MSKYIKLFNTRAEYEEWAATYTEGYPVSIYILNENGTEKEDYRQFCEADADTVSFGYFSGTTELHINATVDWTITAPDWITPSAVSGSCKGDVVLSIQANEGGARNGYLYVNDFAIPFTQAANPDAPIIPPSNQIWYKTSDGNPITFASWAPPFNAQVISNTYSEGMGIIVCNSNITAINSWGLGKDNLTDAYLPDSITSIGNNAFLNAKLNGIRIPDNVQSIGFDVFDCPILASKFICPARLNPETNNYWGAKVYDYEENGLYIRNNKVIGAQGDIVTATIPDGVTEIARRGFAGCYDLTSVDTNDVQVIGDGAFESCQSLTSITLHNGLLSIGEMAFRELPLTAITIPDSVQEIGFFAFDGCQFLAANFVCPASLDPEGNRYWGATVFERIVDGLYITGNAIIGCETGLTGVTIPTGFTVNRGALRNSRETLTTINLNGMTEIPEGVFTYLSHLTTVIGLDEVTSIGEEAFSSCGLTNLNLPKAVTVAMAAFNSNPLESVYLEDVTSIGQYAFQGNDENYSITINNTTVPTGYYPIGYNYSVPIYVPASAVDSYKAAWYWYSGQIQAIQ